MATVEIPDPILTRAREIIRSCKTVPVIASMPHLSAEEREAEREAKAYYGPHLHSDFLASVDLDSPDAYARIVACLLFTVLHERP